MTAARVCVEHGATLCEGPDPLAEWLTCPAGGGHRVDEHSWRVVSRAPYVSVPRPALRYYEVTDIARVARRGAQTVREDIARGLLVPDAVTARGGRLFLGATVDAYARTEPRKVGRPTRTRGREAA